MLKRKKIRTGMGTRQKKESTGDRYDEKLFGMMTIRKDHQRNWDFRV